MPYSFYQSIDLNVRMCQVYEKVFNLLYIQGFEEKIERSKANATEAMKLVELIKKLIKEANETAGIADEKVSSAEGDAEVSYNTANKASNTTMRAKSVSTTKSI